MNKFWTIVLMGCFALTTGTGQAKEPSAQAKYGQVYNGVVAGVTYHIRLVELADLGVIGIELEWRNNTTEEQMLQQRTFGPPIHAIVTNKGVRLTTRVNPAIVADPSMIKIKNGWSVQYLKPKVTTNHFVELKDLLLKGAVKERLNDCRLRVDAGIYIIGMRPETIDAPMKTRTFEKCLLTPEGLSVDAKDLYKQLKWARNE